MPWRNKAQGLKHKHCKSCQRVRSRKMREKNGDKYNAMTRDWRKRNPEKVKAAEKERWKKRRYSKYGITRQDYDILVEQQDNCCPGCQRDLDEVDDVIDHCHDSGLVRGILCRQCNQGLGMLKDDPIIVKRLLEYLGK